MYPTIIFVSVVYCIQIDIASNSHYISRVVMEISLVIIFRSRITYVHSPHKNVETLEKSQIA